MDNLTAKQEAFINLMTESDELARRGFDLLLRRNDPERFFDPLKDAGLFDPALNPAPIQVGPDRFRVPYWNALDYLVALAKLAGKRNDLLLAQDVMGIVRAVSRWRAPDGNAPENYHTARRFAEIIGLVPTAAVSLADLDLVPGWLSVRFELGLVLQAFDVGPLDRFLKSDSIEDSHKAVELLRYCTQPTMDPFWLSELVHHHSRRLGAKIGSAAATIFLERLREIFSLPASHSVLFRPAVEDHEQNRPFRARENWSVEGLRDLLLSWSEHDSNGARQFVADLLRDEAEIARRVAIYVLDKRWDRLQRLYSDFISPQLFQSGHHHELHNLLKHHFDAMSEAVKVATLDAIRTLPRPAWGDNPDRSLKRIQWQWLSAIEGKGYGPADAWLAELAADQTLGGLPEHSEFRSYMETSIGPGPTPYEAQDLVAFAADGNIVDKLNEFEEPGTWRGPTVQALADELQRAVGLAPGSFVQVLPQFILARLPFQHALVSGFWRLWESTGQKQPEVDWPLAWERLVGFFEKLLGSEEFWTQGAEDIQGLSANPDWIASMIAELLRTGTRDDERATPTSLMSRTWSLIQVLLLKLQSVGHKSDDPMSQAINSPRGKAIEALFAHALRACRVRDRECGSHSDVWANMKPVFEQELQKCQDTNYEFSTLAGAYIAQQYYMDANWVENQINVIFSSEFSTNAACAGAGLAAAPASRPVYKLLARHDVLDRLLRSEFRPDTAREFLIQRIALAYLWGDEELSSTRFSYLFDFGRIEDLATVSQFFWSVRAEDLSDEQRGRILTYWEKCVAWSETAVKPAKLMASLGNLTCYLKSAEGREGNLLASVAPYIGSGPTEDWFISDLKRLVEFSPAGVSAALGRLLEASVPTHDYNHSLNSLLEQLAAKDRRQDVIRYAERLRDLPGMQELFDRLRNAPEGQSTKALQ